MMFAGQAVGRGIGQHAAQHPTQCFAGQDIIANVIGWHRSVQSIVVWRHETRARPQIRSAGGRKNGPTSQGVQRTSPDAEGQQAPLAGREDSGHEASWCRARVDDHPLVGTDRAGTRNEYGRT